MKKLAQGAIGTGAGTLAYTVPTGFKATVNDINISNNTTSAITCLMHLVPNGVSVGSSNVFLPTISIPANTVMQWSGVQQLNSGDFIQAIASASGLTMNVTGEEYRP